jgi:hypothetical protein
MGGLYANLKSDCEVHSTEMFSTTMQVFQANNIQEYMSLIPKFVSTSGSGTWPHADCLLIRDSSEPGV